MYSRVAQPTRSRAELALSQLLPGGDAGWHALVFSSAAALLAILATGLKAARVQLAGPLVTALCGGKVDPVPDGCRELALVELGLPDTAAQLREAKARSATTLLAVTSPFLLVELQDTLPLGVSGRKKKEEEKK